VVKWVFKFLSVFCCLFDFFGLMLIFDLINAVFGGVVWVFEGCFWWWLVCFLCLFVGVLFMS
jgi:hypothetical protein